MNKKKFFSVFFIAIFSSLLFPNQVLAVCPVCIVAVGAGVGLSRWLGISDVITGLWVGGLLIASTLWFSNFLKKRKMKFPFQKEIILILFFLITFYPLHASSVIGHPLNRIFGIDKLFFGSIVGTIIFIFAVMIDKYIRIKNDGKVKFYYQKVILPVTLLLLFSVVFFLAKI